MERIYIQWTVVNWITVFLMAALGFLLIGMIAQAGLNVAAGNSPLSGNSGG